MAKINLTPNENLTNKNLKRVMRGYRIKKKLMSF